MSLMRSARSGSTATHSQPESTIPTTPIIWELKERPMWKRLLSPNHWRRLCSANPVKVPQQQQQQHNEQREACDLSVRPHANDCSSPSFSHSSSDDNKERILATPPPKPPAVAVVDEKKEAAETELLSPQLQQLPAAATVSSLPQETTEAAVSPTTTAAAAPAIPRASATERPPRAVRAATHTAATTTSSLERAPPPGVVPHSAPPQPKPLQMQQFQQRPTTFSSSSARAVSYSSTNSRHRRESANDLPPMQQILLFQTEDGSPSSSLSLLQGNNKVPGTIDPAKFMRRVSTLDDDGDMDDDFFDLSSDSEDDEEGGGGGGIGGCLSDDGSSSPTTVILPPSAAAAAASAFPQPPPLSSGPVETTAIAATATPDWMLAWAGSDADAPKMSPNKQEATATSASPAPVPVLADDDTASCSTSSSLTAYLPVEPVPPRAAPHAVFAGGWVAAFWEDMGRCCSDGDAASSVPAVTAQSLYYIQLLEGGTLQLTPAVGGTNAMPVALPLTCDSSCWNVVPVSHRAGCFVSLPSVDLLPVNVPARYLEKLLQGRTAAKNNFFVHGGGEANENTGGDAYAPQAQHDAVMHLRFAMDAALRSSSSAVPSSSP